MINLAYPWLLALLPLPWVLRRLLPAHQEARPALRVPFMERLEELSGRQASRGSAAGSRWSPIRPTRLAESRERTARTS